MPNIKGDTVFLHVVHQDGCQSDKVERLYGPGPYLNPVGYDVPGDFCDCNPVVLWYNDQTPPGHMNFIRDKSNSTRGMI